jgi:hypothetical protein
MLLRALGTSSGEPAGDVRPTETCRGTADRLFARRKSELLDLLEHQTARPVPGSRLLREVVGGGLCGCADLLQRAGTELAVSKARSELPTVLVGGEMTAGAGALLDGLPLGQRGPEQRGRQG